MTLIPPHDPATADPLEARVLAWVLGEASAFEAAELERLCDERPELLIYRRRMLALHQWLGEAEAQRSKNAWKLSPAKRQPLEKLCEEIRPQARRPRWPFAAFGAAAACAIFALMGFQKSEQPLGVEVAGTAGPPASPSVQNRVRMAEKPATLGPNFSAVESTAVLPVGLAASAELGELSDNESIRPLPPLVEDQLAQRTPSAAMNPLGIEEERISGLSPRFPMANAPNNAGPNTNSKRARRTIINPAGGGEIDATDQPISELPFSPQAYSFPQVKSSVAKGISPDPSLVRIEQFYNAVDYGDKADADANGITVIVEQSRHPTLPHRNLLRLSVRPEPGVELRQLQMQVTFNPARMGKYRRLGFEVNAPAEILHKSSVTMQTALYQIEPLPNGVGNIAQVEIQFVDKGKSVTRTVIIPFNSSAPHFNQAKPELQLAGLAMLAAQKFRGGLDGEAIDLKKFNSARSLVGRHYRGNSEAEELLKIIDFAAQ